MPSDLTGAPGRGAGATAGAGSGTGPPDDDDGDGGSRSSGFIRAAGVLLGVVALLVLAILLLMWTRASQRNALQRLARHLGDGRPALLLGVEEQAARGGSLQTRISVADADAAGRPGPPRDLWVQGEEVSIDTARVRVRPSPLDGEPIEAVVFRTVGPPRASGASRQSLVPPAGPPAWAVYRGEDGSAVERQERHFWEAVRRGVSGAADSPGWATEVGAADGVDLALALGDRWSLEIGRDGRVHAERIRRGDASQATFDPRQTVLTRSSLELSIGKSARDVALAGRITPDGAFVRVLLEVRNRAPQPLRLDTPRVLLADGEGRTVPPDETEPLDLPAGESSLVRLLYVAPQGWSGLRLRVTGEELASRERGQPVELRLQPEEPAVGDASGSTSALWVATALQRGAEGSRLVYRVRAELLSLGPDPMPLQPGHFRLDELTLAHAPPVVAETVSAADLPPLEPRPVELRFAVDGSVERAAPRLTWSPGGSGPPLSLRLFTGEDLPARTEAGAAYLRHVAAARHWGLALQLRARNQRFTGRFTGREERALAARDHVAAARRLYPESGIFGREPETEAGAPP